MTLTLFAPRTGQHVTISVPAHRPTRLGSNILLALGTVTLAQVMAPTAAQAQCNSSSNPAPPSPVVANFSNQTFGNNHHWCRTTWHHWASSVATGRMVVTVTPAVPAVRGSRAPRSAARTAA